MADPEHVKILKKGVKAWNEWRRMHPMIAPDLSRAALVGEMAEDANLSLADLSFADLRFASLRSADLSGATLRSAGLNSANLHLTNLKSADLTGAFLPVADLKGTYLDGANFTDVILGLTSFVNVDLSKVIGLETVIHYDASSIGIDTIYKSQGNIPEVFLRKAGVPEDFIAYMRALTAQPIRFYTCFISFTEADDAFSERLYNDLQANGVRCWRWKEDAKWGKTLMREIDEAVRVYDKLIVVCSEQSLNAPAVIREIERALQKENDLARQGKEGEVLFPIRLDDYIFTGWQHHRKADVIAKTVGDFSQWKNHDSYQKAFGRLLCDLKPEG